MLKGERNQVLHSFNWNGGRITRKSFADDDLDAAHVICGTPEALLQQLASEGRKLEVLELAVSVEIKTEADELWPRCVALERCRARRQQQLVNRDHEFNWHLGTYATIRPSMKIRASKTTSWE